MAVDSRSEVGAVVFFVGLLIVRGGGGGIRPDPHGPQGGGAAL